MSIELITGYAGQEHVKAEDFASFNIATIGPDQRVFAKGKEFQAEITGTNSVRVYDGDAMIQGRHIRIDIDTYEDVNFDNGLQGMKRNDLICIQYTKDASTLIESASLVVLKGTSSADSPVDPEVTTGDINKPNGDLVHQMPLYRVSFDGIIIQEPVALFEIKQDGSVVADEVAQNTEDISSLKGFQTMPTNYPNEVEFAGFPAIFKYGTTLTYGTMSAFDFVDQQVREAQLGSYGKTFKDLNFKNPYASEGMETRPIGGYRGSPDLTRFIQAPMSIKRNIVRGKNLGQTITHDQYLEIVRGTFRGLFVGDYWEIPNTSYANGSTGTVTPNAHLIILDINRHCHAEAPNMSGDLPAKASMRMPHITVTVDRLDVSLNDSMTNYTGSFLTVKPTTSNTISNIMNPSSNAATLFGRYRGLEERLLSQLLPAMISSGDQDESIGYTSIDKMVFVNCETGRFQSNSVVDMQTTDSGWGSYGDSQHAGVFSMLPSVQEIISQAPDISLSRAAIAGVGGNYNQVSGYPAFRPYALFEHVGASGVYGSTQSATRTISNKGYSGDFSNFKTTMPWVTSVMSNNRLGGSYAWYDSDTTSKRYGEIRMVFDIGGGAWLSPDLF
jgi:hypothetical protein